MSDNQRRDELEKQGAELDQEVEGLRDGLRRASRELDFNETETGHLRSKISKLEQERDRVMGELRNLEEINLKLASLYAASYRLLESFDRSEVNTAIFEVIANLIGSEEVVVFTLDRESNRLDPTAFLGVDSEQWKPIPLGDGVIGRVASTGEIYMADPVQPGEISACLPLHWEDKVLGAVVVLSLLPQKQGLDPFDREVFDLVAKNAGTAFHMAGLSERLQSS